jgi:hypothetical protein
VYAMWMWVLWFALPAHASSFACWLALENQTRMRAQIEKLGSAWSTASSSTERLLPENLEHWNKTRDANVAAVLQAYRKGTWVEVEDKSGPNLIGAVVEVAEVNLSGVWFLLRNPLKRYSMFTNLSADIRPFDRTDAWRAAAADVLLQADSTKIELFGRLTQSYLQQQPVRMQNKHYHPLRGTPQLIRLRTFGGETSEIEVVLARPGLGRTNYRRVKFDEIRWDWR